MKKLDDVLLRFIEYHLDKAEKKHPVFVEKQNPYQFLVIASEEFLEMLKEINDKNIEKAKDEAGDLIAVLLRFLKEF